MRNGFYYLNNSGSRGVRYENGRPKQYMFQTTNGKTVTRRSIFEEAFGNFGLVCISWKGKRIKVFPDAVLED